MALSVTQITEQIISQLKALDPAISAEVGTPERKIIEAVAEQIAAAQVDFDVLNSQHDVDAMSGSRLEQFLSNFGFGRKRASRAVGFISFGRVAPAEDDIIIPRGTEVVSKQTSDGLPGVVFYTIETGLIPRGGTSASVRAECAIPGTIGNISPDSISGFRNTSASITGISTVNNTQSFTGGIDSENDADLRIRFKNSLFRNISGTTDQYLALAVSVPNVSKANAVGPMSRYREYIQVPAAIDSSQSTEYDPGTLWPTKRTSAVSTIPYSKFTYSTGYYLANSDVGTDIRFYRPNEDYVFNNPRRQDGDSASDINGIDDCTPNVTFLNINVGGEGDGFNPGDVVLLEHTYISENSRNDYLNRILNCVDIFVDGQTKKAVSSVEIMPSEINNFSNDYSSISFRDNYSRVIDGSKPAVGNRLQTLFWQPVIEVPDSITIGSSIYYLAKYYNSGDSLYYNDADFTRPAHYWLVEDISNLYGTVRCRNGIEWSASVPGISLDSDVEGTETIPATAQAGELFELVDYFYDQNVSDIQAVIERHKQITTDVLVHKARTRYFRLYVTIMYSPGATTSVVNGEITKALDTFFRGQYFGSAIQMSDLLQVVHNVPGVDNVRWTSDLDPLVHKVEEVTQNGSSLNVVTYFDKDFYFNDNELVSVPSASALVVKRRAQNTWENA